MESSDLPSLNRQNFARPRTLGWRPAKYLGATASAEQQREGPVINSKNRGAHGEYGNYSRDWDIVRIMHNANVRPSIVPIWNDASRNVRQGVSLCSAAQSNSRHHHQRKNPNAKFLKHLAPLQAGFA